MKLSGLISQVIPAPDEPHLRRAAPPGWGKAHAARWRAGRQPPEFHHISRQVWRWEQRRAFKRAMRGLA